MAFLSLFSPLALAISAPDLAINLLSTHEPMHFTEKYHYVAPLLPGIMISAILGVAWLSRQIARLTKLPEHTVVLALTGIVFASTLYYHHYHGYTPLARAFEKSYQVTSHHQMGASIAREIPIAAAVSAQPNLNPHVSGRGDRDLPGDGLAHAVVRRYLIALKGARQRGVAVIVMIVERGRQHDAGERQHNGMPGQLRQPGQFGVRSKRHPGWPR